MSRIGETIWRIDTPQARIAVISESADIRPNTSITATITAHGTVKVSTIGKMYPVNLRKVRNEIPCETRSNTLIRFAPVMPKVRMAIAMLKASRNPRVTYQFKIFMKRRRLRLFS